MSALLIEHHNTVCHLILNRPDKNNAFDDALIASLQEALDSISEESSTRLIILRANGKHFSAGADLNWMKRMRAYSHQDNIEDANKLAKLMHSLSSHPLPTLCVVNGAAYGGGAGLVAACDMAIASTTAKFCFSEVKLGLIPATISPFVINSLGPRIAKYLFLTANVFNANKACDYGLVQEICEPQELMQQLEKVISTLLKNGPHALQLTKQLVHDIQYRPINNELLRETAQRIATVRCSDEGQQGITSFLNKTPIEW